MTYLRDHTCLRLLVLTLARSVLVAPRAEVQVHKRLGASAATLRLPVPKRTLTRTLPGSTLLFETSAVTPLANSIRSARKPRMGFVEVIVPGGPKADRKSPRLNSSH